MRRLVTLFAVCGTIACAPLATGQSAATANREPIIASGPLRMADGTAVGAADVRTAADGSMTLHVTMARYPLGIYGLHVHGVGRCDGPGFTSAGPHWNPAARQHGRLNPLGTHHGDMPNVSVGQDGIVQESWPLPGTARGDGGLLDADGAAIVLHASPDDERTDPSGNSGARVACAVLTAR